MKTITIYKENDPGEKIWTFNDVRALEETVEITESQKNAIDTLIENNDPFGFVLLKDRKVRIVKY